MKRFFYSSILILISCATVFSQADSSCPQIKIIALGDVTSPGATMTFLVSLDEKTKNIKLKYNWTTSAGTIIYGESTNAVTIDTTGLSDINVTAEVEITGLPENCAQTFSAVGSVSKVPENIDCDSYENISSQDEIARLEQIVMFLRLDSKHVVQFFIITSENGSAKKADKRISRIINYISEQRKISKNRLFFIIEKDDYESTRICIWDNPDKVIDRKNTLIIKGEDFNLKNSSKRKSSPR